MSQPLLDLPHISWAHEGSTFAGAGGDAQSIKISLRHARQTARGGRYLGAAQAVMTEPFDSLAEEWRTATEFVSSLHEMFLHPAYQRIIGLGPAAVPLILRELRDHPDWWFWALTHVTGVNPVSPEAAGDFDQMRSAWLKWGYERAYI